MDRLSGIPNNAANTDLASVLGIGRKIIRDRILGPGQLEGDVPVITILEEIFEHHGDRLPEKYAARIAEHQLKGVPERDDAGFPHEIEA